LGMNGLGMMVEAPALECVGFKRTSHVEDCEPERTAAPLGSCSSRD
jgi:hypothetical protein